jgi:pimeloyl-ACP methyl ester carboxylesterase
MYSFKSSFAESNGIRVHFLEAGEGPLIVLLHGFPELGFSWRHQIAAPLETIRRIAIRSRARSAALVGAFC